MSQWVREYLVQDLSCLSLPKESRTIERAQAAVLLDRWLNSAVDERSAGERLPSFLN